MPRYKCRICKILIRDNLLEIDHLTRTNNLQKWRFHKKCYEIKKIEKIERDAFYEYIKNNFFEIAIPNRFFTGMAEIKCNFKLLFDCCRDVNLINIIANKSFVNDNAKASYIIAVIKGNINTYIKSRDQISVEDEVVIDQFIR